MHGFAMLSKFSILIALVLSLLTAPLAQQATAQSTAGKMPGCAMMNCAHGCCAIMPCCVKSQREQPPPMQAPAPQRTDVQLAAIGLHALTVLHAPPVPEHTFVILDEMSTGHTLPPLAANCIQLI
jgi:hypothetical protein